MQLSLSITFAVIFAILIALLQQSTDGATVSFRSKRQQRHAKSTSLNAEEQQSAIEQDSEDVNQEDIMSVIGEDAEFHRELSTSGTTYNTDLTFPPCIANESQLGYVNGRLSFQQTFINCLNNIADAASLPTIDDGHLKGVMLVGSNIQLNNMHTIDAVTGSVTLDFYLRLFWQDNRFNMSVFWNKVDTKLQKDGFSLMGILADSSIIFWQPDVRFHDVSGFDVLAQTMRVNSSNHFFWSRHILGEYMQPLLEFQNYPNDNQTIYLRYGSFAFNKNYLQMYIVDHPTEGYAAISYNKNYKGDPTFTTNPVWEHDQSWNSYQIYTLKSSNFTNVLYTFSLARTSTGILIRLVVPITILTVIGGLIFWSNPKERVNLTVTLLLSVAAMYVVIISNIPLVGYLTAVDEYCFMMFVVLAVAIVVHQAYYILLIRAEEDETEEVEREKRISEINQLRTNLTEEEAQKAAEQVASGDSLLQDPIYRVGSMGEANSPTKKEKSSSDSTQNVNNKDAMAKFNILSTRDRILFDFRTIVCKCFEIIGRVVIVPIAVLSFSFIFGNEKDMDSQSTVITTVIIAIFLAIVIVSEGFMLSSDVRTAIKNQKQLDDLLVKTTKAEKRKLTWRQYFRLFFSVDTSSYSIKSPKPDGRGKKQIAPVESEEFFEGATS